jgi:hypothetical protein
VTGKIVILVEGARIMHEKTMEGHFIAVFNQGDKEFQLKFKAAGMVFVSQLNNTIST